MEHRIFKLLQQVLDDEVVRKPAALLFIELVEYGAHQLSHTLKSKTPALKPVTSEDFPADDSPRSFLSRLALGEVARQLHKQA
jgi:hypothetical protein